MGRLLSLLVAVVVLVPTLAVAAGTSPAIRSADKLNVAVLLELNRVRADNGVPALRLNGPLADAAEAHSKEMVLGGYFAHESPDGSPFWQRIRRYYRGAPARLLVGENLIWQTRRLSAGGVVRSWLESPEHRTVLLEPGFREVGIAALRVRRAPGVFRGQSIVLVTADFGRR